MTDEKRNSQPEAISLINMMTDGIFETIFMMAMDDIQDPRITFSWDRLGMEIKHDGFSASLEVDLMEGVIKILKSGRTIYCNRPFGVEDPEQTLPVIRLLADELMSIYRQEAIERLRKSYSK